MKLIKIPSPFFLKGDEKVQKNPFQCHSRESGSPDSVYESREQLQTGLLF